MFAATCKWQTEYGLIIIMTSFLSLVMKLLVQWAMKLMSNFTASQVMLYYVTVWVAVKFGVKFHVQA